MAHQLKFFQKWGQWFFHAFVVGVQGTNADDDGVLFEQDGNGGPCGRGRLFTNNLMWIM